MKFLPWKRGYADTEKNGKYVGTFPYVKNQEREALFLYSQPLFLERVRLFSRNGTPKDQNWNGKSVCVPLGYDTTYMASFSSKYSIILELELKKDGTYKKILVRYGLK